MPTTDHRSLTRGALAPLALVLALGACTGVSSTSLLTDVDKRLMNEAAQQALESNKVGESRNWKNPDTGHLGTVTPLKTLTAESPRPCRRYQQTLTVAGATRLAHDTACRQPNGAWLSALNGAFAGFDSYRSSYRAAQDAWGHHHHDYPHYGFGHHRWRGGHGRRRHHHGHGLLFGYGHYF
jgi:surface antigen